MDEKTEKRLRMLLSNVTINKPAQTYKYNGDPWFEESDEIDSETIVVTDPENYELAHGQALTIIKLYRQLPRKGQLKMIDVFKEYLADNSSIEIKKTIVIALCHTDNAQVVIDALKMLTRYDQKSFLGDMIGVATFLKFQPNRFPEGAVEELYDWSSDYFTGSNRLGEHYNEHTILYIEFTPLISRLKAISNTILTESFTKLVDANFNPDINADETKVIEYFEEIGFSKDLIESLNHINEQINNGDTPFKFKNTMDSIRAYTERLFENIASSIDPESVIDGKDSAAAMKYFIEKGLISHDMGQMITNYRHFISNNGVHRLKSKREDARIAKNIALEISLYLMTRLREL